MAKKGSNSRIFLSGEADLSQQEGTLHKFVQLGLSQSTDENDAQTIDDSAILGKQNEKSHAGPLIEVVEERVLNINDTSETTKLGKDSREEAVIDEDEDLPPPLSLFDAITEETYGSVDQSKINSVDKASKDEDGPSLMEQMIAEAKKARKEKEKIETEKTRGSTVKASFGFKKGFLTASSKQPKTSNSRNRVTSKKNSKPPKKVISTTQKDDVFELDADGNLLPSLQSQESSIPTVRPQKATSQSERLVFEEVQEAMRQSPLESLSRGDWTTPDLMEKIAQNPRLMAGMRNPKFTTALEAMQKNPRVAMVQFKDQPEIMDFLKEYFGIVGQYFTTLSDEKNQKRTASGATASRKEDVGPLAENAIRKEAEKKSQGQMGWRSSMDEDEKSKLNEICADKDLVEILMDPNMQYVMQQCSVPGQMKKFMQHPEYGPRIKKLIRAGLLKVEV